MMVKIQKWGNSQGIRIPKSILDAANMMTDEELVLSVEDGKIIIEPIKKHITLRERLENYGDDYAPSEWNTGKPVGREVE